MPEDYQLDIDITNLMTSLKENVKEDIKEFSDLVDLKSAVDREIFIGDIAPGIGSGIDAWIRFWNKYDKEHNIPIEERKPIKLIIDSNGGSLEDTFTIIDSIKLSSTPVWAICVGAAYSGGFFIFISADKRIAYPHASFLFHEGATGTSGTSGQFENYTTFYKKQLDQLKNIVIDNTNITSDEYKEIKRDDIWYEVKDGIEKGFIDEIAETLI